MATVILLLFSATLGQLRVPSHPPQRLLDTDFELARQSVDPKVVPPGSLLRDQSFSVDGRTWVLAYLVPAPGGHFKTGEDGIVIMRDGKVTQVEHSQSSSQIIAVDALAFFDANSDGKKDIVLLDRDSARPGTREFSHFYVYVLGKNGAYARDRDLSIIADGSAEHPSKTIADARACLREAAKPAAPLGPPTHMYKLDGEMDGKKLSCRGKALMEEVLDDDGTRCLEWTLEQVKCKGKGDADWLHRDTRTRSICFENNAWTYSDEIDGMGSCDVSMPDANKSARVPARTASILLTCDWTCRGSGRDACSGLATYDLSPIPTTKH